MMRSKFFIVLTLLLQGLFLSALATAAETPVRPQAKKFRIFDATQYNNKPDMKQYGIEPITVIYGQFLWPNKKVTDSVPQRSFMVWQFLKYASVDSEIPWVIDIEHWSLRGADAEANLEKYMEVLSAAKAANAKVPVGYYGVVPLGDYYPAIAPASSKQAKAWYDDNLRNRKLADAVDYLFPSVYTFYNLPDDWERYAKGQITMARVYGKPVYPFIWPQYHDSNRILKLQFVDGAFWRRQLETMYKYADGLVIWGGWDFDKGQRAKWDENAEWWQETKKFIKEKNGEVGLTRATPAAPAAPAAPEVSQVSER